MERAEYQRMTPVEQEDYVRRRLSGDVLTPEPKTWIVYIWTSLAFLPKPLLILAVLTLGVFSGRLVNTRIVEWKGTVESAAVKAGEFSKRLEAVESLSKNTSDELREQRVELREMYREQLREYRRQAWRTGDGSRMKDLDRKIQAIPPDGEGGP